MKRWYYHFSLKALAVLLATVTFFLTLAAAFTVGFMISRGGYESSLEVLDQKIQEERYSWLCHTIADRYWSSLKGEEVFYSWLIDMEEEYRFTCAILDEDGKALYGDISPAPAGEDFIQIRREVRVGGEWVPGTVKVEESEIIKEDSNEYVYWKDTVYFVDLHMIKSQLGGNAITQDRLLTAMYQCRLWAVAVFFVCGAAFVFLLIYLCHAAGLSPNRKDVKLSFFDRVWLEVYLLLAFILCLFQWNFMEFISALWLQIIILSIFLLMDSFLGILGAMTLATRFKGGAFWSGTLIYRFFCPLKKLWKFIKARVADAKLVPRVVLILSSLAVFDFFLATVLDFTEFLAALLIEGLALMGVLIWYGASIQKLHQDQKRLVQGNLNHRGDISRLAPGLRGFGEDLNRTADGMERAVEEKMRSERFKTELITNVSHDIKTPLTSIVNYVDLMKKEECENEKIKEYLEVLDRQSARLKKLAEDLVESSKAASGSLPMDLAPCDVKVLLEQAMGEYQSAFEEKNLIPCPSYPELPTFILADGKRLWRVLDNLMNNICKYALAGTRVYVSLEKEGDRVKIIFRNISAQALSLSGEDLAERFVRGDASRNTEGSGLGLAIARSLVELQKGNMDIFVDGDLFRVTLTFDQIS